MHAFARDLARAGYRFETPHYPPDRTCGRCGCDADTAMVRQDADDHWVCAGCAERETRCRRMEDHHDEAMLAAPVNSPLAAWHLWRACMWCDFGTGHHDAAREHRRKAWAALRGDA